MSNIVEAGSAVYDEMRRQFDETGGAASEQYELAFGLAVGRELEAEQQRGAPSSEIRS